MIVQINYLSLLSPTGGARNIKAFLRVIREGESNQLDEGPHSAYRARYHPERRVFVEGPLKGRGHPRIFEPLPDGSGRKSSAFGAYQFTATTWDAINEKYGLDDDISEWSQDCHAVALIHDVGALDDVLSGRFAEAVAKCGAVWASLPHSSLQDGGSKVAWMRAQLVWEQHGGGVPHVVATSTKDRGAPPAPIEDRSTMARPEDVARIEAETRTPATPAGPAVDEQETPAMTPVAFIIPLLQSLFEAFSPILRAKVTKALDKQTGDAAVSAQVADRVLDIVRNAAGAALPADAPVAAAAAVHSDPVVAVAAVKQSPQLLAQVEAEVESYLEQIAPLMDRMERLERAEWEATEASRDRAAERSKTDGWDMTPTLVYGTLGFVGFLTLFACAVAVVQVVKAGTPSTEVWAAITGLIGFATGAVISIVSYRFGSSRSSQTKDFAIAELSTRRKA